MHWFRQVFWSPFSMEGIGECWSGIWAIKCSICQGKMIVPTLQRKANWSKPIIFVKCFGERAPIIVMCGIYTLRLHNPPGQRDQRMKVPPNRKLTIFSPSKNISYILRPSFIDSPNTALFCIMLNLSPEISCNSICVETWHPIPQVSHVVKYKLFLVLITKRLFGSLGYDKTGCILTHMI